MFRQDLFHRINVFPITVPPLRDRKEDVLPTAMSILIHLKKSIIFWLIIYHMMVSKL